MKMPNPAATTANSPLADSMFRITAPLLLDVDDAEPALAVSVELPDAEFEPLVADAIMDEATALLLVGLATIRVVVEPYDAAA